MIPGLGREGRLVAVDLGGSVARGLVKAAGHGTVATLAECAVAWVDLAGSPLLPAAIDSGVEEHVRRLLNQGIDGP